MSEHGDGLKQVMDKLTALAEKSKRENRMVFNHVCLRVEDLDEAETLLCKSFGIDRFFRPGGETFDEEKEIRLAWMDDNEICLELTQFERKPDVGYDTGVGQPIGHLSELGFFVPNMEKALEHLEPLGWEVTGRIECDGNRMYKINNAKTPGLPVELIEPSDDGLQF